jgi:hypothetical protein
MDPENVPAVEGDETKAAEPLDELEVDASEEAPDELADAEATPEEEEAFPVEEWSLAPAAAEPPPPPAIDYGAPIQTSGMAIASLVMGIAGWTLLPLVGSILAIVFGYAARRDIRKRPNELTGEGLAIAGLVLGWIMVVLSAIGLCLGAFAFCFMIGIFGSTTGY